MINIYIILSIIQLDYVYLLFVAASRDSLFAGTTEYISDKDNEGIP